MTGSNSFRRFQFLSSNWLDELRGTPFKLAQLIQVTADLYSLEV